jgi:hypothetical protein
MRYRSDLGKSRSTGRITGFAAGSALASALLTVVDAWPQKNSTNPAQRPDPVDLGRAWQERSARFRAQGDHIVAVVRIRPERREN